MVFVCIKWPEMSHHVRELGNFIYHTGICQNMRVYLCYLGVSS